MTRDEVGGMDEDGRRDDASRDGDEDEELAALGRALGYDEDREPPADRVAALRAQAERLRAGEVAGGRAGTGADPGAGGRVRLRAVPRS